MVSARNERTPPERNDGHNGEVVDVGVAGVGVAGVGSSVGISGKGSSVGVTPTCNGKRKSKIRRYLALRQETKRKDKSNNLKLKALYD